MMTCLICHNFSDCEEIVLFEENGKQSSKTEGTTEDCKLLKDQLNAIFLLRKLLDIPKTDCSRLLQNYGNPSSWTDCCNGCFVKVSKAKKLFNQMAILQKQFEEIQKDLKNQIITSVQSNNISNGNNGTNNNAKESVRALIAGQGVPVEIAQHSCSVGKEEIQKRFTCQICSQSFKTLLLWDNHICDNPGPSTSVGKEEIERKFTCQICSQSFVTLLLLENHICDNPGPSGSVGNGKKEIGKTFTCQICSRDFATLLLLDSHICDNPGPSCSVGNGKEEIEKKFTCEICSQGFVTVLLLDSHICGNPGPYPCKLCKKTFKRFGNYKIHFRTHTGEKKEGNECEECGTRFSTVALLKEHMKFHEKYRNFKLAGQGYKLSETVGATSSNSVKKKINTPLQKQETLASEEKKQAAAAALARIEKEKSKKAEVTPQELLVYRQTAFIKEQAQREIAMENLKKLDNAKFGETSSGVQRMIRPNPYIVDGIYFKCSLLEVEMLSKCEVEAKIKEFLVTQSKEELEFTSICTLMIHSCNKGKGKVDSCVETLCKYLDNIINNPDEMKYRKIRCSNKVFQERVADLEGTAEFLTAAGFRKEVLQIDPDDSDSEEEEFWVYSTNKDENEFVTHLNYLRESLLDATPILPEVDRNLQVLTPAQVKQRRDLPDDFYMLSPSEIKLEQRLKMQLEEREGTLRTKELRERDLKGEHRIYKYCVLRIRFPDGITLQGTFSAADKVGALYGFVKENLSEGNTVNFKLVKPGGESLDNTDATLTEYRLPPVTILNFSTLDSADLAPGEKSYLKPVILGLVKDMDS